MYRRFALAARWTPWATILLAAVISTAFYLQVQSEPPSSAPGETMQSFTHWALDADKIRKDWETGSLSPDTWRLITANLVHGNTRHFTNNITALAIVGILLELLLVARFPVIGHLAIPFIFFFSGVSTIVAEAIYAISGGGASAGISGLHGATLVVCPIFIVSVIVSGSRINDVTFFSLIFACHLLSLAIFSAADDLYFKFNRPHATGHIAGFALALIGVFAIWLTGRLRKRARAHIPD